MWVHRWYKIEQAFTIGTRPLENLTFRSAVEVREEILLLRYLVDGFVESVPKEWSPAVVVLGWRGKLAMSVRPQHVWPVFRMLRYYSRNKSQRRLFQTQPCA